MLHVHTVCCLLALLLGRVIEVQAPQVRYPEGFPGFLDLLGTVRLAMVRKPVGKRGGRPRCKWTLEPATSTAMRAFRHLGPPQPLIVHM